jgi:hypothetical protein
MVTDAVVIKDAFYINLGINFDITVVPGLSNKQILTDCIVALHKLSSIQINGKLINQLLLSEIVVQHYLM